MKSLFRRFGRPATRTAGTETRLLREGWSDYARNWNALSARAIGGADARFLGDEWSAEDVGATAGTSYGLPEKHGRAFAEFLKSSLIDPFLRGESLTGLEIGPGGGRVTELLLPRVAVLHVLDSAEMFAHLRRRFPSSIAIRYHEMDGQTLPELPPESLDFVFSFDTFVHFEPRLIFWYLRQMKPALAPGGIGIIHYSDVLTPVGWAQFEKDLAENAGGRRAYGAFGVMCRPLMRKFLEQLELRVVAEPEVVPRDAVVVFEKPARRGP